MCIPDKGLLTPAHNQQMQRTPLITGWPNNWMRSAMVQSSSDAGRMEPFRVRRSMAPGEPSAWAAAATETTMMKCYCYCSGLAENDDKLCGVWCLSCCSSWELEELVCFYIQCPPSLIRADGLAPFILGAHHLISEGIEEKIETTTPNN